MLDVFQINVMVDSEWYVKVDIANGISMVDKANGISMVDSEWYVSAWCMVFQWWKANGMSLVGVWYLSGEW